ncbi:unnamed protein product [Moneuplotes crassus]|uniref:Uncharacterized protein n=1 Tax=Euplotes crassus TaxID=5936 RepID=A0AAD1UL13_EUPCR|nr:unnamed protein product [Moneuplotes crassus]
MKALLLLLLFLFGLTCANDELILVFDLSRHGARAPLVEQYSQDFDVNVGMLSASGMRQHYLIGRYLRKKYIEQMEFLSPQYKEDEIHVTSTHLGRTIQSARCHLIGLYPPESSNNQIQGDFEKSMPLMNLSDDYVGNTRYSIPSKYEPIAVHNNEQKRDTVYSLGSCPYLYSKMNARRENPSAWKKFDAYFKPRIYKKIAEYFGLPEQELNYQSTYVLGDALVSLEFEGLFSRENFTEEEWLDVKRLQIPWLIDSVSPLGNKLMVSKLFNPILEFMLMKMGRDHDNRQLTGFRGTEKYIYFSTHDTMIANFLRFFNPENFELEYVDYASGFIFELYKRPNGEYYVKIFYNNSQIKLHECKNIDCEFDQFYRMFREHGLFQDEVFYICNSGIITPPEFRDSI